MKKIHYILAAVSTCYCLATNLQAGSLHATIVEENSGATGRVNWTILDERGFVPVGNGVGQQIRIQLKPGRYIISVDGDTQGRESVSIGKGHQSIQVKTRKFY